MGRGAWGVGRGAWGVRGVCGDGDGERGWVIGVGQVRATQAGRVGWGGAPMQLSICGAGRGGVWGEGGGAMRERLAAFQGRRWEEEWRERALPLFERLLLRKRA